MNPYPFASLNHFTCPCAILRPLSSGVFSPCVLPPSWRGYLPELAGKPVLRTNKNAAGRLSTRRVSRSLPSLVPTPGDQKPEARITCPRNQVNPFLPHA